MRAIGIRCVRLSMTNVDAVFHDLQERGASIVSPLQDREDRRSFYVSDPDDNWLELAQIHAAKAKLS